MDTKTYWLNLFQNRDSHPLMARMSEDNRREGFGVDFSQEETAKIKTYCSKTDCENLPFFLTIVAIYVYRQTGEGEVTIGVRKKGWSSVMPLAINLDAGDTLSHVLGKVEEAMAALEQYRDTTYEAIMEVLRQSSPERGPLFDVLVEWENTEIPSLTQIENFRLNIKDWGGFLIEYNYHKDQLRPIEVRAINEHLSKLIDYSINAPNCPISKLKYMSDAAYQRVVYNFNATQVNVPQIPVHLQIAQKAAEIPGEAAIIFNDQITTYGELDAKSNTLAHHLRDRGIGRNSVVPIIARRSEKVLIAMLAVLKAGGAYLPIDPDYPKERIDYMLADADCPLALVDAPQVSIEKGVVFPLDDAAFSGDTTPLENINTLEDLSYLIYTSGSTGKPKGVCLTHRTLGNYCANNPYNLAINAIFEEKIKRLVSVTTISFDIFHTESIMPMVNGLTVVMADENQQVMQDQLSALIMAHRVELIQTTPTKMRSYLVDEAHLDYLKQLKVIILGGEALPAKLVSLLKHYTDARIINIYGPTETTIWSTNQEIEFEEAITIGKPIANTQTYVLDAFDNPVPIYISGELCIAGDGVGKGYLHRESLNREKFVPNPFMPRGYMYRTGDLVRWLPNGELDYLGRMDNQVKIRGLRIELGEIENVMSTCEGVERVAVTDKKDESGRQYLVGYYTAATPIADSLFRETLLTQVPKYMVPNYFMHLDTMPLTGSGKTDRKNLPLPDFSQSDKNHYEAPRNDLEKTLCDAFAKVLGKERVGITEDFFYLGGDSLKAIELLMAIQDMGLDLSLQSIFNYPTVAEITEASKTLGASYRKEDFASFKGILTQPHYSEQEAAPAVNQILITGSTGFLGIHLLDALLKKTTHHVTVLVRGEGLEDAQKRQQALLDHYFGKTYAHLAQGRIEVVCGDITKEHLGLTPDTFAKLAEKMDTVIHGAASVKHFGNWAEMKKINTQGTIHVIAFCYAANAALHHISTLSVSGCDMSDCAYDYAPQAPILYDERSLFWGQKMENVYLHSKFDAEVAVLKAKVKGIPSTIYRVGNLTNRQKDLVFQANYHENAFLNRIKVYVEEGYLPEYLRDKPVEFSPVDKCAEAIIALVLHPNPENTIYHIANPHTKTFEEMAQIFERISIPMVFEQDSDYRKRIKKCVKTKKDSEAYQKMLGDLDEAGHLITEDYRIVIDGDATVKVLASLGFSWSEISPHYVQAYVNYFKDMGFFEKI